MDDEKLIELVRAHPVLYDQTDSKYMNSDFKKAIWSRIGAELKTPGSNCKTRWANIRDNFRKSLQKQKTKSGQKGKKVKRYKYTEQLTFLMKFFEERETLTILNEEEQTNQDSIEIDKNTKDAEEEPKPVSEDAEVISHNASKSTLVASTTRLQKRKKLSKDDAPKTAAATLKEYAVKRNESSVTATLPQHPVDAFLAGLAPALKTLPPQEWIHAKREIFDVVHKYELQVLTDLQQSGPGNFSTHSAPSHWSGQSSRSGSCQPTDESEQSQLTGRNE